MLRRKEISEKKSREIELTEAVSMRLLKWTKAFLSFAAIPTACFAFVLGKGCSDTQKTIETGQTQIKEAVTSGRENIHESVEIAKANVASLQNKLPAIGVQIDQLQKDANKYRSVNEHIAKLQDDLTHLQSQVVDLGHKTLRVETLQTTGPGGGSMSFVQSGCSIERAKSGVVTYCAQGNPLALNQMTPDGQIRPVASFSNDGFQDRSNGPRRTCNEPLRGTLYVEKGTIHKADKAFLCVKDDADSYGWLQITMTK